MIFSLLWTLSYYLFLFFLVLIVLRILWDVVAYYKLQGYKKQGIHVDYTFYVGVGRMFIEKESSHDQIEPFSRYYKGKPILAMNQYQSMEPLLTICDPEMKKEFFMKELDCMHKEKIVPNLKIGFFSMKGHDAMKQRAIFSTFFQFEKI